MKYLSCRHRRLWIFGDNCESMTGHSPISPHHLQWWHLDVRYSRIQEMCARHGLFLQGHGLGWLVNKPTVVVVSCRTPWLAVNQWPYLHKWLRIVISPLFKPSSLRETVKTSKWRCKCNTILCIELNMQMGLQEFSGLPMINIVKYFLCFFFAMSFFKIVVDPGYQMVLENPFNKLMKKIWSDDFMYVSLRKIIGEWLDM